MMCIPPGSSPPRRPPLDPSVQRRRYRDRLVFAVETGDRKLARQVYGP